MCGCVEWEGHSHRDRSNGNNQRACLRTRLAVECGACRQARDARDATRAVPDMGRERAPDVAAAWRRLRWTAHVAYAATCETRARLSWRRGKRAPTGRCLRLPEDASHRRIG